MNVGDMKTELRAILRRGDSLDAQLGGFLRRGVDWIEKNHTLQYMRRIWLADLDAGESSVELQPGIKLKTIEVIKGYSADGGLLLGELNKVDLADLEKIPEGLPSYMLD